MNDKEINVMTWDDGSTINGFDKLVKGENIVLNQNGVEFDDFWSFEVRVIRLVYFRSRSIYIRGYIGRLGSWICRVPHESRFFMTIKRRMEFFLAPLLLGKLKSVNVIVCRFA